MIEMNQPSGPNPLDENRQGLIGAPLDRVDGRLKVTGQATYAHEFFADRMAHGFIVGATIARGVIDTIDVADAERAPGVLLVMTYRNAPAQGKPKKSEKDRFATAKPYLDDRIVRHFGEPVAFVVAETFEQARAAAHLVRVRYRKRDGEYTLADSLEHAVKPKPQNEQPPDVSVGRFDHAFAEAPVSVDARYATAHHIHAQMEPHAALAYWQNGRLIVYCATQMLESAQARVANTLRIDKESVRVLSPYIGGGFGGKLPVYADVILSALAARELGRPVKTALTRQQMFFVTTHRTETLQRVRLGAGSDGRLVAIGHDTWSHSARDDTFWENAGLVTRSLYASPNRAIRHRSVALDLPLSDSCRAPGEAVGMLALESAMDELAEKLGLDPIELRKRNEPAVNPEKGIPFSTRQLVRCMDEGARRFGWARRNPKPGQIRDGRWQVGIGMAAASRGNFLRPSQCRVRMTPEGVALVYMSMTDIGTGSYTIFTQVAAEMLGLPMDRVKVELGDSDLPPTAGSGGSFGAASAGSALFDACTNLRRALATRAGIDPARAVFAGGTISDGAKTVPIAQAAGASGTAAEGEIKPGKLMKQYSQQAYGAHFVEVGVDVDSCEIRLRRMLGVFAAGRILNMKTARSQAIGGMIWGVGAALMEEGVVDPRYGLFVNHDIAEYHVPVHADIVELDALFLPEVDDKTNPLKIKGVGELGICGAGAAVANAIYNACGVRVRRFPITLDTILQAQIESPSASLSARPTRS